MRSNKGISMITLIITIIVMIILAAIAFMAAGEQVGSAQFSKFASEFGEYATNFANAPLAEVTEALGLSGKATNNAQKIYAAARDIDLKNFDAILNGVIVPGGYTSPRFQTDIKDGTGATVELASATTPVYEIKSDIMKEYDGKRFYGDANGKETHWVTAKGTVFTLPGYPRIVDGEERMYITADLYYLAGSGDMITADDLIPLEPVKVGGDVVTGNQTVADAADSVTPGEGGETGEEEEETPPDFSDQTTVEGCPLKFGRAYVNEELGMALLPFADGGGLVGSPWWGWATGNVDYLPAGSLTYEGRDISLGGTVMADCNESGTEIYYDGNTFTLEPVLLGTNDFCSHSIMRSEAMHYVQTYIMNQTEKYTGDTYCIYCNELVEEGECKHVNTEIQNAKEATCTEDGYTGDTVCVDCGKDMQKGEIIISTGHVDTNLDTKCDNCNETLDGLFNANGNQLVNWEELVNSYGLNIAIKYNTENDARESATSLYNIIKNNNKLSDATKLVIGNEVTNVGDYAFYGCSSLKNIVLSNNVTEIGNGAFYGCSSLSAFDMPSSVTIIGESTFRGCIALNKISINSNISSIGAYAFYNCQSLNEINLRNSSITIINDNTFYACKSLKSFAIPSTVNYIGEYAFGSSGIQTITIPKSIESVGRSVFVGCIELTTVNFEENSALSNISYAMFEGCKSLKSIIIPESVTTWGNWTFRDCDTITSVGLYESNADVKIPYGLTEIPAAFYGCDNLKTVVLPDSITTISANNFAYNPKLESIYIPIGVKEIPSSAFSNCTALTDVYYAGTSEQWSEITIQNPYNDSLVKATIHYNCAAQ